MQTPEAGLAIYTSSAGLQERMKKGWWSYLTSWITSPKDFVLATIPLDKVVTVKTIIADDKLGSLYEELLNTGKSRVCCTMNGKEGPPNMLDRDFQAVLSSIQHSSDTSPQRLSLHPSKAVLGVYCRRLDSVCVQTMLRLTRFLEVNLA